MTWLKNLGKQPVKNHTYVNVKLVNGDEWNNEEAGDFNWAINNCELDIAEYEVVSTQKGMK